MNRNPLFRAPTGPRLHQHLAIVIALLIGTSCAAHQQPGEEGENELKLTTERVIVFKDGYCLIVKRGFAVTDENGEVYTRKVPDSAVLGSFWATPTQGRLISTIAGWRETIKETQDEVECSQVIEVIEANAEKECELQLADGGLLSGVIAPTRVGASHFVLKTGIGDALVPVADVKRLTIPEMKTTVSRKRSAAERTKQLTFRFEEAGKRREMYLMYFRPGVRWIPTYRINLAEKRNKKTAEMAMQAEILNEAEDFSDVPIDIVVGVPNFRFRSTVSPLVLEGTLRNALLQAAPNLMGQMGNSNTFSNSAMSNALFTQRSSEVRRNNVQANPAANSTIVELPEDLTAGGAQDLFVYNLPKLTLKKGERAAIPVLTTEVPYRDVYTWDLHVKRADIATAPSGSGIQSPLTLSQNQVWRQIELVNNTNLPWTTGAAMITAGQQPLAQELLTYTPPQNEVRVPVTVSVDTRGSFDETEVRRELNAVKWNGYSYARIWQKANLHLRNNKSIATDVEITLRFGGKVDEASDDGQVKLAPFHAADWKNYRGEPGVNNSSIVVWEANVKPGEVFAPSVDYHFYTRQ